MTLLTQGKDLPRLQVYKLHVHVRCWRDSYVKLLLRERPRFKMQKSYLLQKLSSSGDWVPSWKTPVIELDWADSVFGDGEVVRDKTLNWEKTKQTDLQQYVLNISDSIIALLCVISMPGMVSKHTLLNNELTGQRRTGYTQANSFSLGWLTREIYGDLQEKGNLDAPHGRILPTELLLNHILH